MNKAFRNFKKRHISARRIILLAIFLILLAIVWEPVATRLQKSDQKEPAVVTKEDIEVTISASGSIAADEEVSLSFPSTGKLVWIGVREGDSVRRGQGLAKLDTTKLNSDYNRSLSDLRDAQATLERVYDEVKGHETDETFKQKETRTSAEVAKDKAYEAVRKAEKDLKDAVLITPFAGIVSEISKGMIVGAFVLPQEKITIVNPTKFYFRALVDEVDYSKIKLGASAEISLDAFDEEKFQGTVYYIGKSTAFSSTGASVVPVKVKLDYDKRFIFGLSGEAEFVLEE